MALLKAVRAHSSMKISCGISTQRCTTFHNLICVIELGGPDQLWNVLLSNARVIIQLSIPEGIPEFLLSTTQKQKPLITIKDASSYSFLETNPTTWLVDKDDCNSISHLFHRLNDPKLSQQITCNSLPDQFTTVGNAITWFYIASKLSKGERYRARQQRHLPVSSVSSKSVNEQ